MQFRDLLSRFGYSLCAIVLGIHILIPRIRYLGMSSFPATLSLAGYCVCLFIISRYSHRVHGRTGTFLESLQFISWIPLLWLSMTTHHHGLFPFPVLFLILSGIGLITASLLNSWSSGPLLMVFTIVVLVQIIDMAVPESQPVVILDKRPEIFAIPDSLCGYRPKPGAEVKITCWKEGEIVYHVRYHFDEYSRRKVPGSAPIGRSDIPHVIFMGGSCTFGENINDTETLPSQFALLNPDYAVYNYAFIGYGPQQMLALLESDALRSHLPSSHGVLLYGAIPDHVRRAAGSYTTLSWGSDFPRYADINGALKRMGSFANSRRRLTTFFDHIRRSPSLDYLMKYMDSRWSFKPSQWKIFLDILEESRRVYREKFHGDLMVFFWPVSPRSFESLADSVRYRGIPVLDLEPGPMQLDDESLFVPYDVHPSGRYTAYMADALTRALVPVYGTVAHDNRHE